MQIWDLIPHCLWSGGRPSKRTLYTAMSGVWGEEEEIDEFKFGLVGSIAGFWRRNPPLVTILSLLEDRVKGFMIYQLHTVCIQFQLPATGKIEIVPFSKDYHCSHWTALRADLEERFGADLKVNAAATVPWTVLWTVRMNSAWVVLICAIWRSYFIP